MGKGEKEWRTVELLEAAAGHFGASRVPEARLSAEVLLAHVLGKSRLDLYLEHDRPVYADELERFRSLCRERQRGRPVQYLTGEQWFYGRSFAVDGRVLIPRPETELVLEHALERHKALSGEERGGFRALDIGTGSGCIAVTLALREPQAVVTAVDVSAPALDLARENASRHGVRERIRFERADVLQGTFGRIAGGPFDMIVSNPPYIPLREWEGLQPEVRDHEPRTALVAPGGFEFYDAIAERSRELLGPGGLLCVELHADGAGRASEIVSRAGFRRIEVHKDYSGLDRVLSGVVKP